MAGMRQAVVRWRAVVRRAAAARCSAHREKYCTVPCIVHQPLCTGPPIGSRTCANRRHSCLLGGRRLPGARSAANQHIGRLSAHGYVRRRKPPSSSRPMLPPCRQLCVLASSTRLELQSSALRQCRDAHNAHAGSQAAKSVGRRGLGARHQRRLSSGAPGACEWCQAQHWCHLIGALFVLHCTAA